MLKTPRFPTLYAFGTLVDFVSVVYLKSNVFLRPLYRHIHRQPVGPRRSVRVPLRFMLINAHLNGTFPGSLLALGALVGSLSAVYLMDAVGRKAALLAFSVMSLFIGWTLLMAASQYWQLYAGR